MTPARHTCIFIFSPLEVFYWYKVLVQLKPPPFPTPCKVQPIPVFLFPLQFTIEQPEDIPTSICQILDNPDFLFVRKIFLFFPRLHPRLAFTGRADSHLIMFWLFLQMDGFPTMCAKSRMVFVAISIDQVALVDKSLV